MSALEQLHVQCAKRGWRLALTGNAHFQDGTPAPPHWPAMLLDGLEVRGVATADGRELLARVAVDGLSMDLRLEVGALELASALEKQGLIT